MTLTEVHADPKLLADMLNVPFKDGPDPRYHGKYQPELPADQLVMVLFGQYRSELAAN